ncbi:MAG: response regulator transcription factor [Verrucomicrobia bacterium]|nr:response regulator transcription factor [Verrucomicrobiota bacterium]
MENAIKPTGGVKQVVLIDDHPIVLRGLKAELEENLQIHVIGSFSDVKGGIDYCAKVRPEVAIVDLMFGDHEEPDIPKRIKSVSPGTKVLVYSAFSDPAQVHKSFMSEADGYCSKQPGGYPIDDAVIRVANGEAVLDPDISGFIESEPLQGSLKSDLLELIQKWFQSTQQKRAQEKLSVLTSSEMELLRAKNAEGKDVVAAFFLGIEEGTFKNRLRLIRIKLGNIPTRQVLELVKQADG